MKKIGPKELAANPIKLIGEEWMLISSGSKEKFNSMTASWGGMGYLWNKPVAFIFIRPERYTYEFVEKNDFLTLSFFAPEYKKALSIFGSKSGRDTDKVAETGLTPQFTELGNPTYEEARIVMECRKLYSEMLSAESFIDKTAIAKWYGPGNNLHKMYVVEIVNLWIK